MDRNKNPKSDENNSNLTDEEIKNILKNKNDNTELSVDLDVEEDKKENKLIEIPESEYLALKEEIKKQKKAANENFSRLQRAQADFDNYKKLLEKEKQEYCKYAEKGIILKILELIDEFEIALKALKKDMSKIKEIEGIEIIYKKFVDMLNKEEVKPIESVGEPFDPFIHEVLLSEKTDEYPEDTIIEEIKKGYYLKDKVLRPALVKIAKNKERK